MARMGNGQLNCGGRRGSCFVGVAEVVLLLVDFATKLWGDGVIVVAATTVATGGGLRLCVGGADASAAAAADDKDGNNVGDEEEDTRT